MPGFEVVGNEEKEELNKIFKDGSILFAHGFDNLRKRYRVREFEEAFKKKINCKYSIACTSGTAAIKIALKALKINQGDHVLIPAFTFVAVAEAVVDIKAIPIFVECDETLNISINDLRKKISKKTKVIITAGMLGYTSDISNIIKLAKNKGLKVIDDNCESLGAKLDKKYIGNKADITCWSFDSGKTIITGEGGMITTNNKKIWKYCFEYIDHGHENNKKYSRGNDTCKNFGFNYRMNELQAAVGIAQLKKLEYIINQQKYIYNCYKKIISDYKNSIIRPSIKNSEPTYDTLIITFNNELYAKNFANYLKKNKIGTKILPDAIKWHFAKHWSQFEKYLKIRKGSLKKRFQKTENLLSRSVGIPIMIKTTQAKIKKNIKIFNKFKQNL